MPVTPPVRRCRFRLRSPLLVLLLAVLPLAGSLAGCAGFGRIFERPRVRVIGADLANVSLESADLVFDVSIDNPNSLSVFLNAVGYRVRVNGEPFLDGTSNVGTEIAARGLSRVQLPVSFRFADIARILRLIGRDRRADYEIDADFHFDAPVVGGLTVPVHQRGGVPLDRLGIR